MREIKFRIWRVDRKKYVQDEDWYYLSDEGELWNISSHYCNKDFCNPELYIVEQYTGLKDKNGKEIYEGDIVRVFQPFNVPTKAIVELNDGCFELKGIELTWRDYVKCFVVNHAIEIIGNIHEDPELLEVHP